MKKLWVGLLVMLALLLVAPIADAQENEPVTDDDVNRVANQLYCPVCENIPLSSCATQACTQWRGTIREKLEAGWDEQQIKDYFVSQYGERVLAEPRSEGFTLLVWVIPPLAVIVGAFVVWQFLRRAARPAQATPEATPAASDPYVARLEQELERRR